MNEHDDVQTDDSYWTENNVWETDEILSQEDLESLGYDDHYEYDGWDEEDEGDY